MIILRVSLLAAAMICLGVAAAAPAGRGDAAAQAAAPPLPQPADWRPMVQGRLDNGVRYAILPRRGSEPGLGLLMRIEGGFLAERRPGERGLAHLIEHVAFVSPTTGAPDDLRHFVRIGLPLSFPGPSAGTTIWSETNYFVATRTTAAADLDTLLALFRETASDLTFRADAVDEQRADVMREMGERRRGNDISARFIAAAAPGSPPDVIQGQNSDDVPSASIDTIRAFYQRVYRPERAMIVIVGDVDPAQAVALIQRRFGSWRGTGPAPVRAAVPVFQPGRIAPISHSDWAQGQRAATISLVMPTPPPPRSRSRQARGQLMDMLAMRAFNNAISAQQPGAPPNTFGMFIENGEYGHRMLLFWDNFAEGQWRPAIAGLIRTTCRFRTGGTSEAEWMIAKSDVLRELEQRVRDTALVPNVELAKDLSHAVAAGRALIPPDELLRYARLWFPAIGRRSADRWWRRQWQAGTDHVRVEAPELAGVQDPAAAIRAAADEGLVDTRCRVRRR